VRDRIVAKPHRNSVGAVPGCPSSPSRLVRQGRVSLRPRVWHPRARHPQPAARRAPHRTLRQNRNRSSTKYPAAFLLAGTPPTPGEKAREAHSSALFGSDLDLESACGNRGLPTFSLHIHSDGCDTQPAMTTYLGAFEGSSRSNCRFPDPSSFIHTNIGGDSMFWLSCASTIRWMPI